jgi:hypothetical protein
MRAREDSAGRGIDDVESEMAVNYFSLIDRDQFIAAGRLGGGDQRSVHRIAKDPPLRSRISIVSAQLSKSGMRTCSGLRFHFVDGVENFSQRRHLAVADETLRSCSEVRRLESAP